MIWREWHKARLLGSQTLLCSLRNMAPTLRQAKSASGTISTPRRMAVGARRRRPRNTAPACRHASLRIRVLVLFPLVATLSSFSQARVAAGIQALRAPLNILSQLSLLYMVAKPQLCRVTTDVLALI